MLPPWDVFDELADPVFDRYVDLELLGEAWANLDAAALTDVGLQMIEGERILLRPHRAISAAKVLEMAARLAGETRDKTTLQRLARAAERSGDKELGLRVKAAQLLAGQARAPDSRLMVPLDEITPQALAMFHGYQEDIQAARLSGDRTTLEMIQQELKERPELNAKQIGHLQRLATTAKTAIPEKQDPQEEILNRLAAGIRAARGGHGGGGGRAGGFSGGRASGHSGVRPGGRPSGHSGVRPGGRPPGTSTTRPGGRPPGTSGGRPGGRSPGTTIARTGGRSLPARIRSNTLPRNHAGFTRSSYSHRHHCRMWLGRNGSWYYWSRYYWCYIPVQYIYEYPPDPDPDVPDPDGPPYPDAPQ
jgi:hypothetical protein